MDGLRKVYQQINRTQDTFFTYIRETYHTITAISMAAKQVATPAKNTTSAQKFRGKRRGRYPELTHHGDMSYLGRITYQQFPLILDPLQENAERGNADLPCVAHGLTSVISSSGDVYICGRLNIHDWCKPMGNIGRSSFSAIWRGEERRKPAQQLRDPTFCRQYCPQCRITKYNTLFDQQTRVRTRTFI